MCRKKKLSQCFFLITENQGISDDMKYWRISQDLHSLFFWANTHMCHPHHSLYFLKKKSILADFLFKKMVGWNAFFGIKYSIVWINEKQKVCTHQEKQHEKIKRKKYRFRNNVWRQADEWRKKNLKIVLACLNSEAKFKYLFMIQHEKLAKRINRWAHRGCGARELTFLSV